MKETEDGISSFQEMVKETFDKLQQINAAFHLRKIDELEERLSQIEAEILQLL